MTQKYFFCFFQNFGGSSRATETYPNLTYCNVESGYNTHKELLTGVFGGENTYLYYNKNP